MDTFQNLIRSISSPFKGKNLLLACSGGVDSMVLAHLCHRAGLDFSLAHCNYNLRGVESQNDSKLVLKAAEGYGVQCFTKSFHHTKEMENSIQLWARRVRYEWFKELMEQHDFDYLLTAHHLDDALETFLINLSRGTGIEGLLGIPSGDNGVIRPLLHISKKDIYAYANKEGIEWREDTSNKGSKYLRNRFRNEVIPVLESVVPDIRHGFQNTIKYLKQDQKFLTHQAEKWESKHLIRQDKDYVISLAAVEQLNYFPNLGWRVFRNYGFEHWEEVLKLTQSTTGSIMESSTHILLKNRDRMLIRPKSGSDEFDRVYLINEGDTQCAAPISLFIQEVSELGKLSPLILYVDKEKLNYPLVIRRWEEGDYFCPLGMQGKRKKLSKYFKDERLSHFDKENQWLLCSGKHVVWVIGQRADERYKVTPSTKKIIQITWEK